MSITEDDETMCDETMAMTTEGDEIMMMTTEGDETMIMMMTTVA